MTSRPIIFSAPMVRAILAGTKTQTRRVYKFRASDNLEDPLGALWALPSPYGAPGDRLWVRETWAAVDSLCCGVEREEPICVGYKADLTAWHRYGREEDDFQCDVFDWNWEHPSVRWRPSIYMPRWASRITLEVTGVRVARLQEITADDARAEGVEPYSKSAWDPHRLGFANLWDVINGKRAPWASNPWVWVVEFKRVEALQGVAL